MKSFGLALIVTFAMGAACPVLASFYASPLAAPVDVHNGPLVQLAGYGDPPRAGRHGGNRKTRVSKSATPGVSTTKGVSQEEADKQYRQKYGF